MPFKKLFLTGATFLALGALTPNGYATQNPQAATLNTDKAVQSVQKKEENLDSVQRVINAAVQQYRVGEQQFNDGEYDMARAAFDRAVDTLLEAGFDVRKDTRFHTFYLDLVDRIYKHQMLAMQGGRVRADPPRRLLKPAFPPEDRMGVEHRSRPP